MEQIPESTMQDQDGNTVTHQGLSTGRVVLFFYPKDDTPGCTKEACGFRDDWGAFEEAGIRVYGISKDDAASHQRFREKYGLPFPLLTADEDTLERFGVWKQKNLYGRTYMGIDRQTFLFHDGKVVKHFAKVQPEGHAREVLDAMAAVA